jgi:DNA-binding NarL/FixJ family response regulator
MQTSNAANGLRLATRVVITDTRQVLRAGYARHLSTMAGIEVVGETPDLEQLRAAAERLRPDAVMASIALLAPLWLEPVPRRRDMGIPQPLLVAMPEVHDAHLAVAAWAGAGGYVLEDTSPTELATALRLVAARQGTWSAEDRYRALRWQDEIGRPWRSLTEREREVMRALARGMSNAAIAAATALTPKTVEHHVSSILSKLGLASRTQAVVWYFEQFPANLRRA